MNLKSLLIGLVSVGICCSARAQYSMDWSKIAGGGGTSTGAVYSLSGTIGQHDAGGPMSGGQFSLTGGFWALPTALQTDGAPTLTIAPAAPGFISISWAPNAAGFVLQEKLDLNTVNWANAASGATNNVLLPIISANKFYRLNKP